MGRVREHVEKSYFVSRPNKRRNFLKAPPGKPTNGPDIGITPSSGTTASLGSARSSSAPQPNLDHDLVAEPWLVTCLGVAKSKGIVVERVISDPNAANPYLSKKLFLLNGKLVHIHKTEPVHLNKYGQLNINVHDVKTKFATIAFLTNGTEYLIYVLPNRVL